MGHDGGRRPLRHHPPAVDARARPHVHHVIGGADRLLVVLDHDHRVAEIAQPQQAGQQSGVVALVQADGRFVQHVHHPDQPRADLRRQPDALGLAAGQRVGAALQTQIIQPDVDQKIQPLADFLDDLDGDFAAPARQTQLFEELAGRADGQRDDLRHTLAGDEHMAGGAGQPRAPAGRTGPTAKIFRQFVAHQVRFGFPVAPLHVGDDPLE